MTCGVQDKSAETNHINFGLITSCSIILYIQENVSPFSHKFLIASTLLIGDDGRISLCLIEFPSILPG